MTDAADPPDRPTAMNNATGKRLLALIRDGDYAHPGEEEANELLFAGVRPDRAPPRPRRRLRRRGHGRLGAGARAGGGDRRRDRRPDRSAGPCTPP